MAMIEARTRPLAAVAENVAHVLWEVRFRFGRPRIRGIVFRRRERIAQSVRVIVAWSPHRAEGCGVVNRAAIEANRSNRAKLRDRSASLNRTSTGFGHVADRRIVRTHGPGPHVIRFHHRPVSYTHLRAH